MMDRPGIFITIALIAISSALMMRAFPPSDAPLSHAYLRQGDVQGMAVRKEHKLYTLNFAQQQAVVDLLNRTIEVGSEVLERVKGDSPPFDMLVIYLFNDSEVAIRPVALVDKEYVFSAPKWHKEGFLKDVSQGDLYTLLEEAYTP